MFWKIVLLDFCKAKGISNCPNSEKFLELPCLQSAESESLRAVGACAAAEGSWVPQPGLGGKALASYGAVPAPILPSDRHHSTLRSQDLPAQPGQELGEVHLSSCPAFSLGFPFFGNQGIQEVWKEDPDLGLMWCPQLLIPMLRLSLRVSYHISLALEVHTIVTLTLRIFGYRQVFWKLQFLDNP